MFPFPASFNELKLYSLAPVGGKWYGYIRGPHSHASGREPLSHEYVSSQVGIGRPRSSFHSMDGRQRIKVVQVFDSLELRWSVLPPMILMHQLYNSWIQRLLCMSGGDVIWPALESGAALGRSAGANLFGMCTYTCSGEGAAGHFYVRCKCFRRGMIKLALGPAVDRRD